MEHIPLSRRQHHGNDGFVTRPWSNSDAPDDPDQITTDASLLLEKGAHSSQILCDLGQTCKIKRTFGINISYCFVRQIRISNGHHE
jgi:hypothetical protein